MNPYNPFSSNDLSLSPLNMAFFNRKPQPEIKTDKNKICKKNKIYSNNVFILYNPYTNYKLKC